MNTVYPKNTLIYIRSCLQSIRPVSQKVIVSWKTGAKTLLSKAPSV